MSSGGTSVLVHLSRGLDATEWEQRHARGEVPDAWPYGLHRLRNYDLQVTAVKSRVAPRAPAARALRALGGYEWRETVATLRDGQAADIRLCWDERTGVPAALLAKRGRQAPVATGVIWLTDALGRPRGALAGAPAGLAAASRVWALSSAQIPVLRDVFGVPESRLRHLLFGIDADFFRPARTDPTPGLVVSVGNDRHRDHATLIAGVAEAAKRVSGVRLELVTGQDVDVPAWLGRRHARLPHREVLDLYARASVIVVALRPNLHVSGISVVLEAMATGRPIVVTGTPGMSDYVDHGETGLLFPAGDADALADAVTRLLLDPESAAGIGSAARRAIDSRLNTQAQAERLAQILQGV